MMKISKSRLSLNWLTTSIMIISKTNRHTSLTRWLNISFNDVLNEIDAKKLLKFKTFSRCFSLHDNVQLNQLYRDQISLKTSNFRLISENSIRSIFARWKILWSTLCSTTRILTSFKKCHYKNDEKLSMKTWNYRSISLFFIIWKIIY
jgi:hypothetical protein